MRYHKEEQLNEDIEACYVKHCNSTRPAYVMIVSPKRAMPVEQMHLYQPMGLKRQHGKQGSILGRFFNRELGLCSHQIASQELGMKDSKHLVSLPIIPQAIAKRRKTAADMTGHWEAARKSFAIEETELNLK